MSDVMSGSGLTTGVIDALWNAARLAEADMVAFTQRLIRTVSLPAEEGEIAKVVASEMQTLGYDKVWIDEIGSVIGFIGATGQESGRVRRSIPTMLMPNTATMTATMTNIARNATTTTATARPVLTSSAWRSAMTLATSDQIAAMNANRNPIPGMSPRIAMSDGE